jgi:hypothetical protein
MVAEQRAPSHAAIRGARSAAQLPQAVRHNKAGGMRCLAVLGLAVAVAVAGCATMFSGSNRVAVATNPAGATVYVDDVEVGRTPILVTLDPRDNLGAIRIELPGFAPVVLMRNRSLNGWFWANLLFGGFGMIIDAITGDMFEFDDAPVAIGMTPLYPPAPQGYPPAPQGYPPAGSYPPAQPYPPQPYPPAAAPQPSPRATPPQPYPPAAAPPAARQPAPSAPQPYPYAQPPASAPGNAPPPPPR